MQGSDQPPVITLVLPAPATMAGALPSGPLPGPGGSNMANLASNSGLTREKLSLQVDAPAMLCRRDHLMVSAIVLSTPATTAGALTVGPPPGPGGSNETNHGPNRARTKEKERWEGDARDTHKHTLHGVRHQAIGSTTIPPLRTTKSHY
ncbi:phospholipid-transporting ATPase 8 [Dorcoceras hygrometricum]|uniref:Phospholipid-transporting ATPase 8 n=1 Tax=Dorcoceras hygrometricum TaxID=472368 RepID=A0A2Z7CFX1_9LAMI|nr:phospholipid-transporting ATPase 8 [Dorcoceras hygrometricum]